MILYTCENKMRSGGFGMKKTQEKTFWFLRAAPFLTRSVRSTLLIMAWNVPSHSLAQETVNYREEVMAVLSRAGCNQGTCHGNLNGKGGFKLSLRGEDPDKDHAALTRD